MESNAQLILTKDVKQSIAPKSEVLFEQTLKSVNDLTKQPKSSFSTTSDFFKLNDRIGTHGTVNPAYGTLDIPRTTVGRLTFFSTTLKEKRLGYLSSFNLNLKVSVYKLGSISLTTTPTDFVVPLYFTLNFTPYPVTNPFNGKTLLNLPIGQLMYNASLDLFTINAPTLTFNLLDTIPSRLYDSKDFSNNQLLNRNDRITKDQLNQILNVGELGLETQVGVDISGLSTNNQNYMTSFDLIYQTIQANIVFQYYGTLANLVN